MMDTRQDTAVQSIHDYKPRDNLQLSVAGLAGQMHLLLDSGIHASVLDA